MFSRQSFDNRHKYKNKLKYHLTVFILYFHILTAIKTFRPITLILLKGIDNSTLMSNYRQINLQKITMGNLSSINEGDSLNISSFNNFSKFQEKSLQSFGFSNLFLLFMRGSQIFYVYVAGTIKDLNLNFINLENLNNLLFKLAKIK